MSYHKKNTIQFQMRCQYGHIYNSSLTKMTRLYSCCTGQCKTESYKRRAAQITKTFVVKAAKEMEIVFKTPLWAGYVLVNVFSKPETRHKWATKICLYDHETVSMTTRIKAGYQCSHILCRMAKTIKTVFNIKMYEFKNGATIRYMGWENAVIEMLLQLYPHEKKLYFLLYHFSV